MTLLTLSLFESIRLMRFFFPGFLKSHYSPSSRRQNFRTAIAKRAHEGPTQPLEISEKKDNATLLNKIDISFGLVGCKTYLLQFFIRLITEWTFV
jgi:hypothetical protein